MCTVVGLAAMVASLVVRSFLLLPAGAVVLIAVSLQPFPSGMLLRLHPIFTAAWLAYVPTTDAGARYPPALGDVTGPAVLVGWIGVVLLSGLVVARRYEPR